jgi:hypothetical protein
MKRLQAAILVAEILSYALMITFIFADMMFNLTRIFRPEGEGLSPQMAFVGACLVGLVGTINVWLTWYYMHKSNTMRDWLVICAWTHRVKYAGRWVSLEEFLIEHLGFNVSHGLSTIEIAEMRDELDAKWRQFKAGSPGSTTGQPGVAPAGGAAPSPAT